MKHQRLGSGGNYVPRVLELADQLAGQLRAGEHWLVVVAHDSWCGIFTGEPCNCDPELRAIRLNDFEGAERNDP